MTNISTGAIKRIEKSTYGNIGLLKAFSLVNWFLRKDFGRIHPTYIQPNNALIGNIKLAVVKSRKSNIVFPAIVISDKGPNESEHKALRKNRGIIII